jgi:hypothetical protein
MKVYTEDVRQLLDSCIQLYESHNKHIRVQPDKLINFFNSFCDSINNVTGSSLRSETLYKHLYLRLKSWDNEQIGYSVDYLNSLSQYLHKREYSDVYKTVFEDDIEIPEFPWTNPSFPATPAIPIDVPGYSNVWIKDESLNPTGIAKDRLAWEIFLFYEKLIRKIYSHDRRLKIPRLSLISSGNAALSIQFILNKFGLPNLKVIIDPKFVDVEIQNALIKSKCEIYHYDLEKRKLTTEDILKITGNTDGKDITYGYELDKFSYYDWMSYEILNLNPQFCFVPFGSGDLYKNVLEINHRELMSKRSSKRFFGNKEILQKCVFIGVRAKENTTRYKMLYSRYNALEKEDLNYFYEKGTCSKQSDVFYLNENKSDFKLASEIAVSHKINFEPSGIAGLVSFLQLKDKLKIPKDAKIIVVNTGKIRLDLFK